ncbi:MAG TPA: LapA family protein [Smithellaceae bacterium]|nr:LapA family protein [Smithellaceae bacterium]HRY37865.1 LapA family protein [Smithellaceae bacterium]
MKIFYLILTLIFAFFIVTFSQFNSAPVTIKYYYLQEIVVPAYMLIFVALMAGIIITGLLGVVERFRLNRTISRLNKTIRDLRKELRDHEAPPMVEDRKKISNPSP